MTRKKLLAAILVLLALLAAVSLSSAETKKIGAYTVEFLDEDAGTVRIVGYSVPTELQDQETIELKIPSDLNGYVVTEIGSDAFKNQRKLSKVIIPEGVTAIGSKAFSGCDGIESVRLPSSLTSIGNKAFSNCKQLRTVTIPVSVAQIGDNPFAMCDNLSEIIR